MEINNNETNSIPTLSGNFQNLSSHSNDKTFNRLRDLQSLIKKESALKELCKKINIKYFLIFYFSHKNKK